MANTSTDFGAFEDQQLSSKARFNTEKGFCVGAGPSEVARSNFPYPGNGKGFNMKQEQALKRIDKALSDLEKALAAGESEQLKIYLRFLGQFHQYSFGNMILIWSQFPEASLVAGYRKWQTMNRFVRKGEKGIRILAPLVGKAKSKDNYSDSQDDEVRVFGFKAVSVFDISQTEGEELPTLGCYQGDPENNTLALEQFAESKGIEIRWEIPDGGAMGISTGGMVQVDPSLPMAQRFSVLVHELAHELLHRSDRRKDTTKALRETEAEAVAYAVCSAVGLESNDHAADYIQLHQGDVEKLKLSLDLIRDAASEILAVLSDKQSSAVEV